MKPSHSKGVFRPFEDLKALLGNQSLPLQEKSSVSSIVASESTNDPDSDSAAFESAMADVKRIKRDMYVEPGFEAPVPPDSCNEIESEALARLENLVKTGTGFIVAYTPEYIEGTACNVNPSVTKRLHRGDFSVQAHLDLHGLCVEDARQEFGDFLQRSIAAGKRMVLIIHGRGLSSPAEPILKNKVYKWLTSGPWRKWVMAFSSARWCDGGAGATYILLRQRPLTKRFRKKKPRISTKP
jgi:DNA-nicking Smr family endonuclease